MARLANDSGLFRVIVDSATKRGYPIRLGRVKSRYAEGFRNCAPELEDAVRLAVPARPAVIEWVNALAPDLHNKLVTAGLTPPRVVTGLQAWCEKHLASKVRMKERSKAKLRDTHAKMLAFFASDIRIDKIDVGQAWDWHTWLHEQKLSNATIKTHCGNVKAIFNAAVKRGLIARNAFADLPSGTTAAADGAYLSVKDAEAVIEKLPTTAYKLLFSVGRFAGLRIPSECRPLRRVDVDMQAGIIHVRCTKTEEHQHRQERYVPICPRLRPLMQARLDECGDDELCPMGSVIEIGGYARRVIEDAVQAAGVKRWPDMFQTLRSSLAKDWKAQGVPEFAVDAWLGHNNVTSRKHYTSNVPPQMFELISGVKQAAQIRRKLCRKRAEMANPSRNQ